MDISCIKAVYFSPTGNTEKVVLSLAKTVGHTIQKPVQIINFTDPEKRLDKMIFEPTDLVVFGVPVYAGRVPNKILPFIQNCIQGKGALAVPVVTFGNRSFDDALKELSEVLNANGLNTVGAAAVVSKHVFSTKMAANRPDQEDQMKIEGFANRIADRIQKENLKLGTNTEADEIIDIPGNTPIGPYYIPLGIDGNPAKFLKAKPKTDTEKCIQCRVCVNACPMGSIEALNVTEVTGICIKCHACVRKCPQDAKFFDNPSFLSHVAMLEANYMRRAESVFVMREFAGRDVGLDVEAEV